MNKNKSIDGLRVRTPKKSPVAPAKTSSQPKTSSRPKVKPSTSTKTKAAPARPQPKTQKIPITEPQTPPTQSASHTPKTIDPVADFLKPVQAFNFDDGELKATNSKAMKPIKTNLKPKKPKTKKRKIILIVIFIILLIIAGLLTGFIIWGNDIIAKITGGKSGVFDLINLTEETYEPLKTDANGRTNILAFGTSGYNMDGEVGDGTHDGAALTDSIMVISLDQTTGDIAMLSLPRDLKASPTCTATGKINEVYWCNNMAGDDEEAGATALMTEVGSILGLDFQYYAHVNWGSLVQIVDILDGITITLDEDIEDYYWTNAVYQAGVEYTLNGEEALGLARARHGTTSGDFSRGASQQKILIGIKNKALAKNLSLTDGIGLANTLGDNLRTNFSLDEIKTIYHLTADFNFDTIRQLSLLEPERLMTTGSIDGISYVLPSAGVGNYEDIQEFIAKSLSSDPRSYEEYTILVLNGTDLTGLAAIEKDSLESTGYFNITIDDAPAGNYHTDYTLYVVSESAPGTQKLLEEKYQTTAKPLTDAEISLPQDYTFILILGQSH